MDRPTYEPKNTDRLKSIVLGSGNVYMIPYSSANATMPTDEEFEKDENMVGRTKSGAKFNYSAQFYTAKSDDGVAKKRKMTSEEASFSWGIMTWSAPTIASLLRTAAASTETEGGKTVAVVEGGGLISQTAKKYWLHFVGGDDVDGKITLTGLGENIGALELAFSNESETIISPNFDFDPYDDAGHLYKIKMANQVTPTNEEETAEE